MKLRCGFAGLLVIAGCLLLTPMSDGQDKQKSDGANKPDNVKKKRVPAKPIIVNGELINADLKDKVYSQSFCKTFTFKMEKGTSYQIEMSSVNFRACLRLEDLNGQQLSTAIDQIGNQRAIILYDPSKTADYQIVATTINGGATGKFSLTIKDASAHMVFNRTEKLNQNDKAYKVANKKHKVFLIPFEAGKTYQIDMRSGNFDSYLFLESPKGKAITQDDDGGGYPSARIIYKATQTGKFRVVATHFGGGGNLGEFTLTVRNTDGAPIGGGPGGDKAFADKK